MKVKDTKRIKEVLESIASSGFAYYIYQSNLSGCLSLKCRIKCWYRGCFCPPEEKSLPVYFRKVLEKLGTTFIKLGQLLSVHPDFIPDEFCEELRKLQDNVPGFSSSEFQKVEQIILAELGKPVSEIFSSFSESPIASASVAQVHEASLKNGKKVAVKVQRPDVKDQIQQDLRILHWLSHFMEKYWKACRPFRPKKLVDEFSEWTQRELDFRNEAKSMTFVKNNFKENQTIVIPKVFWELTTKRVLTMSFLEGSKLYDEAGLIKLAINKKELAINGARIMFEQTLIHGFFHADPHPGNILAMRNNRLGFMDFGIVGILSPNVRKKMLMVLNHLLNQDFYRTADHILELAVTSELSNVQEYREKLYVIFRSWYGSTLAQNSLSQIFFKGLTHGVHYNVFFPPDLVLFSKALVTTESVGTLLYPRFDMSEHLKPFIEEAAKSQLSPVTSIKKFVENSIEYGSIIENLPLYANIFLKKLVEPEQKVKINMEEFLGMKNEIHRINKMRTLGVIIASLILSSAIILHLEGSKYILGFSLGLFQMVIALVLAVIVAMLMINSK